MGKIKFSFTLNAPNYKGVLCMCAYLNTGGKTQRNYRVVKGLISPNYSNWDNIQQRFIEPTPTAIANNELLSNLRALADEVLRVGVSSTIEFLDALCTGVAPKEVITLADFIEVYIDEQRKNATKNYQLYVTLLNNLKGENHKSIKGVVKTFPKPMCNGVALADTPISEVSNLHLSSFADWVKTEKGGENYNNLNSNLHHVIRVAIERGLNLNKITYRFRADAPKKVTINTDEEKVLTLEQFNAVSAMSGTLVNPTGFRNRNLQQLYLDTALLMYYTLSRPADVLLFRSDMIHQTDKGNWVLRYIPTKKRTYNNAQQHTVTIPLHATALSIIRKYKHQSKGGYLLPLSLNDSQWDITTVEGWHNWRLASNKTLGNVNAHLKKVGEKLGLDFGLTLYAFRRSAISHALDKGENIAKIAKRAGTSVAMISKHYYKDTEF